MNVSSTAEKKLFSGEVLTRKAYLNSIASAANVSARVLVSFVTAPILVAGLGSQVYGVWRVLQRMTGYLDAVQGHRGLP